LTIACEACNRRKDNLPVEEFVKDPVKLARILAQAKAPLKDAAAVNATRYAIGNELKSLGLPVSFWSGGRTKMNRIAQDYPKDHWVDAACVGETGAEVKIAAGRKPLAISALGRGTRQMCLMSKFGFPRTAAKAAKRVHEFQTGDMVVLNQPAGKYAGKHFGQVAVRTRGDFDVTAVLNGKKQKITATWRNFRLLQRFDGYSYQI
jgi:hypothetical protein